ncbi:hypothetical protein Droror1_Dr00017825 [Drosera rotundifolia]
MSPHLESEFQTQPTISHSDLLRNKHQQIGEIERENRAVAGDKWPKRSDQRGGDGEGRALGGGLRAGRGKHEGEGLGKRRKGRVSRFDLGGFLKMFVGDVAMLRTLDLTRSNSSNALSQVLFH